MRMLVVIASYGRRSDKYLWRIVQEYQSMSFDVDIVVCTNAYKPVPPGVQLVVGVPNKDPWSLPFAHKPIVAERVNDYDLFVYSEDDTLATERNIQAFLGASEVLGSDEIAGFLRYERHEDDTISYCDVNGHYHWDESSVVFRGKDLFAFFTNEHAAFYILTRDQLRRSISSGGYVVPPHRGKYDLACTAATDPYTQCGFRKLVCISRIEDFLLHHLPNKYIGTRFGTHETLFHKQVQALKSQNQRGDKVEVTLLPTETRLRDAWYSKDYYEPVRPEVIRQIPQTVKRVLSIGCGSGETERRLASMGKAVTAICIDRIIASCAEGPGVEVVWGSLVEIKERLRDRTFDCLLFSNVLHLSPNPEVLFEDLVSLLEPDGYCVILAPNLKSLRIILGKLRMDPVFLPIGKHELSGTHSIGVSTLRRWMRRLDMHISQKQWLLSKSKRWLSQVTLGAMDFVLANEMLVVGRKH